MTESLMIVLDRLEKRVRELVAENERLSARNAELELSNEDLLRKMAEAESVRDRALLDAEYLSMSHRLADDPDTIVATRRRIAGLIRNIDRCLVMLKE